MEKPKIKLRLWRIVASDNTIYAFPTREAYSIIHRAFGNAVRIPFVKIGYVRP